MSTQQPEALRLAEILELGSRQFNNEASTELRRLHALNAELLEALKLNYAELSSQWTPYIRANEKEVAAMKAARAAIAKAEGREA
jgi:hypothetical protein